jgi:hypothetical protein
MIRMRVASKYQHMAQVTSKLAFCDDTFTGLLIFWITRDIAMATELITCDCVI